VPITLPASAANQAARHPLDLAKPILFDCDYDYKPDEDARLTVKWFRNKEAEPFYQWLPELNVRHFADWIKALVNETFISDPHDPLKRYRSLLIKRLSMNLTGSYTCLVSSLANQDMQEASLVVYQPPRSLTFEHRIFPAPALLVPASQSQLAAIGPHNYYNPNQRKLEPAQGGGEPQFRPGASPTQFRGFGQQTAIVRPPNNDDSSNGTKIVYTHDGRPIRRKSKRQVAADGQISKWMLQNKRLLPSESESEEQRQRQLQQQQQQQQGEQSFVLQLHHFQCQASQVSPRPVIVLTVKRGSDSIAQYLHESSSVSIRPYQVKHAQYFELGGLQANETARGPQGRQEERQPDWEEWRRAEGHDELAVTLYDITVSATVALNVSLRSLGPTAAPLASGGGGATSSSGWRRPAGERRFGHQEQQAAGISTVLSFARGQRMSFECHLEITGTEFEQRRRININEEG